MAHYLFAAGDGATGSPSRDQAAALMGRGMWAVGADERHRGALAAGDLVLIYLAAPQSEFIGRAELASAAHDWTPAEAEAYPGGSPGGVLLARVETWDPPVPMSAVLAQIDPSENAKAEFDTGVVRITVGEYETAVRVAAERATPPTKYRPGVVPESELVTTEHGLVPKGEGWFVVNARETHWWKRDGRGVLCEFEGAGFEGATDFHQLGINLTLLGPGEPMSMYHWEADQEDFLVLSGEALLIVEGEERLLRQWDFVHCPPGANHTIAGAGTRPCLVLAVGARDRSTGPDWGAYTVDAAALRHGAGVERETTDPEEAYARFSGGGLTRYGGWLPE